MPSQPPAPPSGTAIPVGDAPDIFDRIHAQQTSGGDVFDRIHAQAQSQSGTIPPPPSGTAVKIFDVKVPGQPVTQMMKFCST